MTLPNSSSEISEVRVAKAHAVVAFLLVWVSVIQLRLFGSMQVLCKFEADSDTYVSSLDRTVVLVMLSIWAATLFVATVQCIFSLALFVSKDPAEWNKMSTVHDTIMSILLILHYILTSLIGFFLGGWLYEVFFQDVCSQNVSWAYSVSILVTFLFLTICGHIILSVLVLLLCSVGFPVVFIVQGLASRVATSPSPEVVV